MNPLYKFCFHASFPSGFTKGNNQISIQAKGLRKITFPEREVNKINLPQFRRRFKENALAKDKIGHLEGSNKEEGKQFLIVVLNANHALTRFVGVPREFLRDSPCFVLFFFLRKLQRR